MGRDSASYRVGRTKVAAQDLSGLRRREPTVYAEALRLIQALAANPDMGYELRDEWAGKRSLHFARDRYRIIWVVDDAEQTIVVVRVGKKYASDGASIYGELADDY